MDILASIDVDDLEKAVARYIPGPGSSRAAASASKPWNSWAGIPLYSSW